MKLKKPLRLRLRYPFSRRLVTFDGADWYAFSLKKDNDYYSKLFDIHGKCILDFDFKILRWYEDYLFITERRSNLQTLGTLKIIDLKYGKILFSTYIFDEKPDIYIYPKFKYDGYSVFGLKDADTLEILNFKGLVIDRKVQNVEDHDGVLIYSSGKNTYILSNFFENYFDVIALTSGFPNKMFLCGDNVNGEFIYSAVGTKGYRPQEYYFKKYYEEKSGIVVKLCSEKGEDLNSLAFIERETGKVKVFENAVSLQLESNNRIFVTRKKDEMKEPDEQWYYIDLCDYSGNIIGTYKDVYYGFLSVSYGVFDKTLAIVLDENDELHYVDEDGNSYPMPNNFEKDIEEYRSVAGCYRAFRNPLCKSWEK